MAEPAPTGHPVEARFVKLTRYQYYLFFFLYISKIPVFWHFVNITFLTPRLNHTCKLAVNVTKCPCDQYEWDRSIFTETITTRFNICNPAKEQLCHSLMFTGALIGSFVFGFLSDRFGRLKIMCITFLFTGIFGCLVSAMPNLPLLIAMRVFEGFGVGGAIITSFVLCVEYCGVRQRELVTALYHVPLNIGHMSIALVSYFLRSYVTLQLACSIPVALFAIMYIICYESPKWLVDSNRIDRAAVVMDKIAKWNKTSYPDIKGEMQRYHDTHLGGKPKGKFKDIFKYRPLVINFFCMCFIYFACGTGYYGVTQFVGRMSGNIHVNMAMSGAMLIPATCSCIFLLYYLSRRTFLMLTSVISGTLLLIVALAIPKRLNTLSVVLACISNCFYFMSFIIVFLYGVELFPTSVRNSVLGVLSVLSRFGMIIAPFINTLSQKAAGCAFGALAVIGAILCIPLPETKNKELPSSLEQYAESLMAARAAPNQPVNIKT